MLGARLLPLEAFAQDAVPGMLPEWMPSVYIGIEPDGAVKIVAHRSEMGTGMPHVRCRMIVADELEADWDRVTIVQAPGRSRSTARRTPTGRVR